MSGDAAALRLTLQQDGLNLAPSMLDKDKVPRRMVLDLGLEEVDTKILLNILEVAAKARLGGSDAERQRVQQQLIGAAAKLNPVLRIYDLAVDTPAVGVDAKAEARGSPLSPKGYKADADVRGARLRCLDRADAERAACGLSAAAQGDRHGLDRHRRRDRPSPFTWRRRRRNG